ncbi:MAG: bifunctional acetaldehyde-CoA/alcohol dehydrogenase [Mollicutes bacterium]|nr:bifunctional acetaldehyde-CoA/alcohol dehydrogenase [Mollicutes bacterium]MDD7714759.1 bifunctional acetaldehyde-CoA/alcohol dehydrogenase [Mollicutes bacterium]MDY3905128.1 bifunctional acetaldehyde-CoA/alcohol dehydrogenase [Candidatus Enteromonas sp.]MDY4935219.1 bifunctional acetaldehyde-CoA/alcohol dehydrogenase [Candidatus Enteromonas sp.]
MKETKLSPEEAKQAAIKEVDELVKKGLKALDDFASYDQEKIDYIVAKMSVAGLDHHGILARKAIEETHRGVFEDKATKNLFACEYIVNNMRHLKTVGIIKDDPVTGITEIAEPVGVICGVTPVTNPTSTVIFKSLIAIKTRNPIIFGFHPKAQECSKAAAIVMRDAAIAAGAPENCIQWIEHPSMDATSALMNHPGVATILATGGNAMVKAAYSCGKPALGVGAGNVPCYIDRSADIPETVNDVVLSKSFDNGMICASESAVFIDEPIYKETVEMFKKYRVYFASKEEKRMLEKYMFGVNKGDANVDQARLNADVAGMSAYNIAKNAGFEIPATCQIIAVNCSEVGVSEPMSREKLSPVLSVYKVKDYNEGFEMCEKMLEFGGLGHSAAIHCKEQAMSDAFGDKVKAIRIIWNSPSTFGGIGNVYNSFLPSLTLGCGSYGHNSVAGNVSAINLLNIKRVGKRRNTMQWFKVPQKIYFERNSIQYLRSAKDVGKVFIVTDHSMVELGFLNKIIDELNQRRNPVTYQLFAEVEPDPDITTVRRGVELMKQFAPDTIIALGGGSAMDAAKGMWIFYEHPEVNFDDLKQKFMDIRKRAFKYPELGRKSKLICIPTTSGTGSEVTPFAVISDKKNLKKYPLTDYSLTPSIAIVDPEFTTNIPARSTAYTGMDVLTHAIEAYTSVMASDYTDGLALEAIKLVFTYLPRAVKDGRHDLKAREKMHNAATIAGMAFANAFLGITHSIAHKMGAEFHTIHGQTCAILLPHVIKYNGTQPTKLSVWPKYEEYQCDQKYLEICRTLGLKASTPEEATLVLSKAVMDLGKEIGIDMNFASLIPDEEVYNSKLEEIGYLAYEDQCTPANPREPLVEDMIQIMKDAYKGN